MRQYYIYLKQEKAALRIQAAYKGYVVRKHFLAAKLRFESIVKSIDGNDIEVSWPHQFLCKPVLKDMRTAKRLKQIEAEEKAIEEELRSVRAAMQKRKEALLINFTS